MGTNGERTRLCNNNNSKFSAHSAENYKVKDELRLTLKGSNDSGDGASWNIVLTRHKEKGFTIWYNSYWKEILSLAATLSITEHCIS